MRLETARLTLTPVTAADLEALHEIWTAPGVRRFLWDDEIVSRERVRSIVTTSTRLWSANRYGLWTARRHDETVPIGVGGFWYFHEPPRLELVYGLRDEETGRGFATELARALVEFGRTSLHLAEILASTDAANLRSRRVLAKLRFAVERQTVAAGRDTCFYRLELSLGSQGDDRVDAGRPEGRDEDRHERGCREDAGRRDVGEEVGRTDAE